jgi:hypothetical protein
MFDFTKEPRYIVSEFEGVMIREGSHFEDWLIGIADSPETIGNTSQKILITECVSEKGAINVKDFLISHRKLKSEDLLENKKGKFLYIRKVD